MKKNSTLFWFLVLTIVCFCLPWLFTRPSIWEGLVFKGKGEIGDTIGGTMTPFLTIIGAWLTYKAFKIQYDANENQRKDIRIERFENKFYELLRIHKENVQDISEYLSIEHSKLFTYLIKELDCHFKIKYMSIEKVTMTNSKIELDDFSSIKQGYGSFFNGIQEHYNKPLFKDHYVSISKGELNRKIRIIELRKRTKNDNIFVSRVATLDHEPFQAKSEQLGKYFRHTIRICEHIIKQVKENSFTKEDAYEYFKTFRAQLSKNEQLLLYINAVILFPKDWEEFIIDYRLLKNLDYDQLKEFPKQIHPEEIYKDRFYNSSAQEKNGNKKELIEVFKEYSS